MRSIVRTLLLLAFVLVPAGCRTSDEQFILYVAPRTAECTGEGVHQCLLVRRSPKSEWLFFYDEIVGFRYEPGFDWTLRVASRPIANPPADGSSVEYRLLGVIGKVAAPAP